MEAITQQKISRLIQQFEARTLIKSDWTHEAHLIVAVWYVWSYSYDEALKRVREGIFCYNEAVGTVNSDSSGYHETLTQFWLKLANWYVDRHTFSSLPAACKGFLASQFCDKGFPLIYYSRDLLFSVEARKRWIAPDLRPLSFD
ncbi:MAG: hypothetical protein AAF694_11180 [Bacteroidota bacterium]